MKTLQRSIFIKIQRENKREWKQKSERRKDGILLVPKMEEGLQNKEARQHLEAGKRQGNRFSHKSSRRNTTLQTYF